MRGRDFHIRRSVFFPQAGGRLGLLEAFRFRHGGGYHKQSDGRSAVIRFRKYTIAAHEHARTDGRTHARTHLPSVGRVLDSRGVRRDYSNLRTGTTERPT